MALLLSVPYNVVCDTGAQSSGIREGCPREGPWAEVKYKCLRKDAYQLCSDLLGQWAVSGSSIYRIPAFTYPPSPQLFCTDIVSIEQLGKPLPFPFSGLPYLAGQLAVVTARFSIPGYTQDGSDQSGQPFTKLSYSNSGEFLTLPDTTFWFADGTPTTTPIGLLIPQIDYTWTRYKMPFIPDVEMATLCGKVNIDSFAISKRFTAAPGTVLFMAGQCQVDGNVQAMFTYEAGYPFTYTAEYHWLWKPIPWNYFFHPNRVSGFQPVTDGNGNPPFTPYVFTNALP